MAGSCARARSFDIHVSTARLQGRRRYAPATFVSAVGARLRATRTSQRKQPSVGRRPVRTSMCVHAAVHGPLPAHTSLCVRDSYSRHPCRSPFPTLRAAFAFKFGCPAEFVGVRRRRLSSLNTASMACVVPRLMRLASTNSEQVCGLEDFQLTGSSPPRRHKSSVRARARGRCRTRGRSRCGRRCWRCRRAGAAAA